MGETGKSLTEFGLPSPDMEKEQFLQNCLRDQYIADEEDFSPKQAKAFYEANHPKLNEDQRFVFDYITGLIRVSEKGSGKLIFLDAPGGTGKTFTLNVIISWI